MEKPPLFFSVKTTIRPWISVAGCPGELKSLTL